MKYSIITCAYNNFRQFENFLHTAMHQNYPDPYEVFVVDNATPNDEIKQACYKYFPFSSAAQLRSNITICYHCIESKDKRCTNITQGINIAAKKAAGQYLVIVADSNVLLSYNLLSEIDRVIQPYTVVLSGPCDAKISPDGTKASEYNDTPNKADINEELLITAGWPCDPFNLQLDKIPHRFPPPHQTYDVYVVALDRLKFIELDGYDETHTTWGTYHHYMVEGLCKQLHKIKLGTVRIVHQYHDVLKEKSVA